MRQTGPRKISVLIETWWAISHAKNPNTRETPKKGYAFDVQAHGEACQSSIVNKLPRVKGRRASSPIHVWNGSKDEAVGYVTILHKKSGPKPAPLSETFSTRSLEICETRTKPSLPWTIGYISCIRTKLNITVMGSIGDSMKPCRR